MVAVNVSGDKRWIKESNITKISQTLYLHQAHGADNGYVVCIAENIVGKSKDSSFLRILCMYSKFNVLAILCFSGSVIEELIVSHKS